MHSAVLDAVLNFIHGNGLTVLPEMELLLFALGILIFDHLLEEQEKYWNAILALLAIAASGLGLFMQVKRVSAIHESRSDVPGLLGFQNTIVVDGFFLVFAAILLTTTALVILHSIRYLELHRAQRGEYYALLLFAVIGMMFMACGSDLIVLLIGLELMSLSLYVLAVFLTTEKRSSKAGLKYLLLGGFGTALLAYGFSILYGITASTSIWEIGDILDRRRQYVTGHGLTDWLIVLAFATIAAGLFVKIAAVPFHQWVTDVSKFAPAPFVAFVSGVATVAGFALLLRLFVGVFGGSQPAWRNLIATIAIVSLAWGNFAALLQFNLKRLLAYSCISQVGFTLLGLVAANETGLTGVIYSLLVYPIVTIGVFAVVVMLQQGGTTSETLDDLDGLLQRSPAAAILLALFILSLAGMPLTAGYRGKYFIFKSLFESNHRGLAIAAAICLLPSLYYSIRVLLHVFRKRFGRTAAIPMSAAEAVVLGAAAFVSLAAGLYAEPFTRLAHYAFGP
jgi:NADH-quinone oxidoreductase subunit N